MGTKINLRQYTNKYIGKNYKLGEIDCFSIVYQYLKDKNFKVPDSFNNVSFENYSNLYLRNKKEAKNLMISFFNLLLLEIKIGEIKAGDILLLSLHGDEFPAISVGNGMILSASPKLGVNLISRNYFKTIKAWSCQNNKLLISTM